MTATVSGPERSGPTRPPGADRTDVLVESTLAALRVPGLIVSRSTGPRFSRLIVRPSAGIRASRIMRAVDDIGIALGVESIRAELAPDGVALEIPRPDPQPVHLGPLMAGAAWPDSPIAFALGRDVGGVPWTADLARMPHLLIAGATGTGKSVALNVLIASMLARAPSDAIRLVMIDAKRVELAPYAGIRQLARPIVTEVEDAERVLGQLVRMMEQRYAILRRQGARQVSDMARPLRRYVVIVDEMADLVMSSKIITGHLIRLAQKSRAAGIHLVLATQRPSSDVISGLLKANVPGRIALATVNNVDSRVIIDQAGAEDLLGRGDMLFKPPWLLEPVRLQGAYVSDDELEAIIAPHRVPSITATTASGPAQRPETADKLRWAVYAWAAALLALAAIVVAGGMGGN